MKSYKELIVWQKSIVLVREVFIITEQFPKSELYGLTAQMRRSAIAIPSNIAEGYGRKSPKEYHQFCSIAYASALELETQIIIAKDLAFAQISVFKQGDACLDEVLRMLYVMNNKIKEQYANR